MERDVGITVGGDQITFHCHGTGTTVKLQALVDSDDPGLLLQWAILWQLLRLNENVDKANAQTTAAAKAINPSELIDKMMAQFRK